jgi:hypothetical protein
MMPRSDDGLVHRLGALALAIAPVLAGLEVAGSNPLMEAALLRLAWRSNSICNSADTDLASDNLARCPWSSQVRAVADGAPASKPRNLHDSVSAVESISRLWFGCAYLMRKEDK